MYEGLEANPTKQRATDKDVERTGASQDLLWLERDNRRATHLLHLQ